MTTSATTPDMGGARVTARDRCAVLVAAAALVLFAGSELILALPVGPLPYAGLLALLGIGILRLRPLERQPRRVIAFAIACAVVATLHFVPWTPRKPFLRDLARIEPGMTAAEVEGIMSGYLRGTGWPADPFSDSPELSGELAIPGALVHRHTDGARFGSDWGIVHLRGDGRVDRVEFSPD